MHRCAFNTLKLLIELRHPFKKPASERIVGAGVSSFWAAEFSEGLLKNYPFIGGQKKLNTVSQVTENPKMTQCWEAVQFESDISFKWLWIKTSSCCHSKPIFTTYQESIEICFTFLSPRSCIFKVCK